MAMGYPWKRLLNGNPSPAPAFLGGDGGDFDLVAQWRRDHLQGC
jgi:hypothetical protein